MSLPRATAAPAREGPVPLAHGTTDKAAGVSDTCVRMCAIMQSLHCPNDPPDCVQHCEEMRSLPICTSQMGAFIACVAARSAAECHCNEEGESEVRGTTCDAEQEAVATCIEQAS